MNSARLISQKWKNQRFAQALQRSKNLGIRKLEFDVSIQFLRKVNTAINRKQ